MSDAQAVQGAYTYTDGSGTPNGFGILFIGNGQAMLFGRDHNRQQCFFVLSYEGPHWIVWRHEGLTGGHPVLTRVGHMVMFERADGSIVVEDSIDPVELGDTGFSPPPPKVFSGVVTKIA
jgi:hypothetical protein